MDKCPIRLVLLLCKYDNFGWTLGSPKQNQSIVLDINITSLIHINVNTH